MYLYEVSKPSLKKIVFIKINCRCEQQFKTSLFFLQGEMEGRTLSRGGGTNIVNDVRDLASQVNSSGFTMPWRIFTNDYWSPTKINNSTHALKYTKQTDNKSFLDFLIKFDSKSTIQTMVH